MKKYEKIMKSINSYCASNRISVVPIQALEYDLDNDENRFAYALLKAKGYIQVVGTSENPIGVKRLDPGTAYFFDKQQKRKVYWLGFASGAVATLIGELGVELISRFL